MAFASRSFVKANAAGNPAATKSATTFVTEAEVLQLAESSPETLSPNALLRPVVQDYLVSDSRILRRARLRFRISRNPK